MRGMTNRGTDTAENGRRFKLIRLVMTLLCVCVMLSLLPVYSYNPLEADYLLAGMWDMVPHSNLLGQFGTRIGWTLLMVFGIAVYPVVALGIVSCLRRLLRPDRSKPFSFDYLLFYILLACGLSMLFGLWPDAFGRWTEALNLRTLPGGTLGQRLASPEGMLTVFMNGTGVLIMASFVTVVSAGMIIYSDWYPCFMSAKKDRETEEGLPADDVFDISERYAHNDQADEPAKPKSYRRIEKKQEQPESVQEEYAVSQPSSGNGDYVLPGVALLDADSQNDAVVDEKEIERTKHLLQATLNNFNIDAQVVGAIPGPQVTLFEIKTAPGLKLNSITSLERNFLMDLSAQSLRILAPIPGKDLVGMEIPNEKRAIVSMRSLVQDKSWQNAREQIPLILGKDISNKPQILDLAKAPHVLVAGTTGSGKSVCMNLLIESMLLKFSPDELRFIMIDPKVVEFQAYSTLPHLIAPIINEPLEVPLALNWAINEMERRYRILAQVGVTNITAYNRRPPLPEDADPILDEFGEPIPEKLPFIVLIIDELADIMLVAKSEVENKLSRIAAKSRAVGIHTIVATQRPDVKTLTGTIKANFPVRIAFRTASQVDSQTIINGKGAESLLGNGDMLFVPPGASDIKRIQCGMASDEERNRVVAFVSRQLPQNFDSSVLRAPEDIDAASSGDTAESGDSMFDQAVKIILTSRRPTVSYLQRTLQIGYNKAASLMEDLEKRGVVGPQIGTAPRQILIKSEDDVPSGDE